MRLRRLRPVALRLAPGLVADRDRRYQAQLRQQLGFPARALAWVAEHGEVVTAGPLAGLRYPAELLCHADAPLGKLQGTYEAPLGEALDKALNRLRSTGGTFVDLGCADGYYAVGVGVATGCGVVGFDLARSARRATRALAAANDVEIDIRGRADERSVIELGRTTAFLLCDIEGAELDVLTERAAEKLRQAHVIVELHGDTARRELSRRFGMTHDCTIVDLPSTGDEEMRTTPTPWLVALPHG